MSMIWRSAMPLLTTLAALVIIVHCIEEDLEAEYRRDLRPRILDTGARIIDESWRPAEEASLIQQPRHTADWDDTLDDLPKRRRPGRKRKRRPQTSDAEQSQDRFAYLDQPHRPYYDVDDENNHQTTDMPKRRRKKPQERPSRWVDDDIMVVERPVRQRGTRRKRPSLDPWPVLSEFGPIPDIHDGTEDKRDVVDKTHSQDIVEGAFGNDRELSNHRIINKKLDRKTPQIEPVDAGVDEHIANTRFADDKSLSEFSLELVPNIRATKPNMGVASEVHEGYEKAGESVNMEPGTENENIQVNSPMDPVTLKDILKRSNGTSLSEILQQHNLSLSDLLSGKEQAVSIFKSQDSYEDHNRHEDQRLYTSDKETDYRPDIKEEFDEQKLLKSENKFSAELVTEYFTTVQDEQVTSQNETETTTTSTSSTTTSSTSPTTTYITTKPPEENLPKISNRRRYPTSLRKKLRMRPMLNVTNTLKGQLSRDLIAQNARKYSNHRRVTNKSREWKEVIPSMKSINHTIENSTTVIYETTTITTMPEETTIPIEIESNNHTLIEIRPVTQSKPKLDDIDMDIIDSTTISTVVTEILTEIAKNISEKPVIIPIVKPTGSLSGLRRQAFNNRLKRKRLKQKNLTTESPPDDVLKHLLGMGNLVSSSEFIARTEEPRTTRGDEKQYTTSDDDITTEMITTYDEPVHIHIKSTVQTTQKPILQYTTEVTAKIEIQEILNDTQTSAKLSRILKERNMTLSELVDHRERGSSHVHLADIFHNASKEPNPPEPFLSKSLLEPISKETYPLRAILEANLHDANGKITTIDPSTVNIPVVMDYGSNVNENAENMGIMSLFKNFTRHSTKSKLRPVIEEKNEIEEIIPDKSISNDTARESRVLNSDDVVSWHEIFSLMGKTSNETEDLFVGRPKKVLLDEDTDGDGLILLEDLQHLVELDNSVAFTPSDSTEKIEVRIVEKNHVLKNRGILDKIPSQTKSVTIATACIAGLAMILFLLTYAAYKWKQQNSIMCTKRNLCSHRIPTPVFENRKGHKNNNSSRSISPMLQSSNIYTLNTLDSKSGKESPDYMWDSLRKPFQ